MGRVLLTDRAWPDEGTERAIVERAGHTLVAGPPAGGDAASIEALVVAHRPDAIMTCWSPVNAAAIAAAPRLRVVARMGVGLDNIAVDAAARAGVWVTNVPDYCVEEVSDHALGLILAWARGIALLDGRVKRGEWNPAAARLRRLATLTAGVVGFGRIGRATARKLHGIGLRVLAYNTSAVNVPDYVELAESRGALLERSDVVVLHVPLRPETRHLVDTRFLGSMKAGAFLVNVSRGPVVDTAALLDALRAGHLSGAGLDVVEGEPSPPAELVGREDVIATPHVAFSSESSVDELRTRAAQEVVRVLSGSPPEHPCNTPLSERASS